MSPWAIRLEVDLANSFASLITPDRSITKIISPGTTTLNIHWRCKERNIFTYVLKRKSPTMQSLVFKNFLEPFLLQLYFHFTSTLSRDLRLTTRYATASGPPDTPQLIQIYSQVLRRFRTSILRPKSCSL